MSVVITRPIPKGSCPNCGHKQFIVKELSSTLYLTNRDGEVIDSQEDYDIAVGKCLSCGKEYDMYPAYNSFIPLTPLRKVLYDFQPAILDRTNDTFDNLQNPIMYRE